MTTLQADRIRKHGENLLAIFPNATERDPVKLCKKLRRIETSLSRTMVSYCNGTYSSDQVDRAEAKEIQKMGDLLWGLTVPDVPVFVNRDPRGYALKIDDQWMRDNSADTQVGNIGGNTRADAVLRLHRDWGGYGIIAPEIDGK